MRENWSSEFPTRSDTNRPVQSQKKVRILKLWVEVEEEFLRSENKGADQLCSYCTADLRLCFCIGKIPVFSWRGSFLWVMKCLSDPLSHGLVVSGSLWKSKVMDFIPVGTGCVLEQNALTPHSIG